MGTFNCIYCGKTAKDLDFLSIIDRRNIILGKILVNIGWYKKHAYITVNITWAKAQSPIPKQTYFTSTFLPKYRINIWHIVVSTVHERLRKEIEYSSKIKKGTDRGIVLPILIWLDSFPLLRQRTRTGHYFPISPNCSKPRHAFPLNRL